MLNFKWDSWNVCKGTLYGCIIPLATRILPLNIITTPKNSTRTFAPDFSIRRKISPIHLVKWRRKMKGRKNAIYSWAIYFNFLYQMKIDWIDFVNPITKSFLMDCNTGILEQLKSFVHQLNVIFDIKNHFILLILWHD